MVTSGLVRFRSSNFFTIETTDISLLIISTHYDSVLLFYIVSRLTS